MREAFQQFYRGLGRGTSAILIACVAFVCVAAVSALFGMAGAAQAFGSLSQIAAYLGFGAFVLFMAATLVGAVASWIEGRSRAKT